MAIPAPRNLRIASGARRKTSLPSNRISPLLAVTPRGNSRIMAWAVSDLPDPDSPTMQRISSGWMRRLTPSTAWARSAPGGSETIKSLIAISGPGISAACGD
jgi:hypothetical protein